MNCDSFSLLQNHNAISISVWKFPVTYSTFTATAATFHFWPHIFPTTYLGTEWVKYLKSIKSEFWSLQGQLGWSFLDSWGLNRLKLLGETEKDLFIVVLLLRALLHIYTFFSEQSTETNNNRSISIFPSAERMPEEATVLVNVIACWMP